MCLTLYYKLKFAVPQAVFGFGQVTLPTKNRIADTFILLLCCSEFFNTSTLYTSMFHCFNIAMKINVKFNTELVGFSLKFINNLKLSYLFIVKQKTFLVYFCFLLSSHWVKVATDFNVFLLIEHKSYNFLRKFISKNNFFGGNTIKLQCFFLIEKDIKPAEIDSSVL